LKHRFNGKLRNTTLINAHILSSKIGIEIIQEYEKV